jgi:hypothetical protein
MSTQYFPNSFSGQVTYYCIIFIMSSSIRPSGHNKQYYEEEEALFIYLKTQRLSWPQVVAQFNAAVASDRQRNVAGLRNKWCQLNSPQYA